MSSQDFFKSIRGGRVSSERNCRPVRFRVGPSVYSLRPIIPSTNSDDVESALVTVARLDPSPTSQNERTLIVGSIQCVNKSMAFAIFMACVVAVTITVYRWG